MLSNIFEISLLNISIWVPVLTEETENDIKIKMVFNDLIPNDMNSVCWFWKCNVVHRCHTRVSYKHEDPYIKEWFDFVLRWNYQFIFEASLFFWRFNLGVFICWHTVVWLNINYFFDQLWLTLIRDIHKLSIDSTIESLFNLQILLSVFLISLLWHASASAS